MKSNASGRRRRWISRIGKLGLLLFSTAFGLLVAEGYFRLFDPQAIVPRYVETAPYGVRKHMGDVRGSIKKSHYSHGFSTNSAGFRGTREYAKTKPVDTYRAIVLGDSVALGHGVEDDETFAAVTEQILGRKRPTEVINMAVAGFGTAEELVTLRGVGFDYEPDLVIMAYFSNDPMNNEISQLFRLENGRLVRDQDNFLPAIYVRDRLNRIPGYDFLCQHSHLVNKVRRGFSAYFSRKLQAQHQIESIPNTLTPEQEALTAALVNEVIRETDSRGIDLIILNIPTWRNVIDEAGPTRTNNFPRHLVTEAVNTFILEVEEGPYAGRKVEEVIHDNSYHPRPAGHRVLAHYLADFIESRLWSDGRADGARDSSAPETTSVEDDVGEGPVGPSIGG